MGRSKSRRPSVHHWLHYADLALAPMCRSATGFIVPVTAWPQCADHRVAPLCRSSNGSYVPVGDIHTLGRWPTGAPMSLTRGAPGLRVRPLPGMHVVAQGDGKIAVCRDDERDAPLCGAAAVWLAAVRILTTDLFSGRQHVLREGLVPSPPPPPSLHGPSLSEGRRSLRIAPSAAADGRGRS